MPKSFTELTSFLRSRTYSSNYDNEEDYIQSVSTALKVTDNLTAKPGGGAEDATAIDDGVDIFGTVGSIGDSAVLTNDLTLGKPFYIFNRALNQISVLPTSGGSINGNVDGEFGVNGRTAVMGIRIGDNDFILINAAEI